MIASLSLCLEDLAASADDERFLCCTATPGGRPGLGLSAAGAVVWLSDAVLAAELWVTADERLALLRSAAAPEVVLERGGRRLTVPAEKPVIVLEGDVLTVAGRAHRVFVHGRTRTPTAPYYFKAVAAASLGLALGAAAGCEPALRADVEAGPSALAVGEPSVSASASAPLAASAAEVPSGSAEPLAGSASASTSASAGPPASASARPPEPKNLPIEVREHPPKPAPSDWD